MERLTIKAPSGVIRLKNNKEMTVNTAIKKLAEYEDIGTVEDFKKALENVRTLSRMYEKLSDQEVEEYHKLAEYEDLEEQGKLLKLPCAVVDTVYQIDECGEITELEVLYITFFGDEIQLTCKELKKYGEVHHYRPGFSIGRKVFYTKEAAEAALKEMSE